MDDDAVYRQLSSNLNALYARYPETFARKGLVTNKGEVEDISFLTDDADQMSIEMLSARPAPFDLETTQQALWKCCTMSHVPLPSGYFSALGVEDGVLRAVFMLPMQICRQSVTVKMRVALKRFVEPHNNRVVHIWDSLSKLESPHKMYDGVQFLDNGWTVVEALPTTNVDHPSTVVQFYWHIIPDTSSFSKQSPVGLLSDVFVGTYTTMFQSLSEVLENLVLDAVLAKKQETASPR